MRLIDATKSFDDAIAFDAYTGLELFHCNFTSYDDHAASGTTARRRVLFVPPGTAIPDRAAINLFGEIWIVGQGIQDSYGGLVVRVAHGMKKATDLASFATPGAMLTGGALNQAYVQRNFFKDTYDMLTEADSNIGWNVFLPPIETIARGHIIAANEGVLLRVRKTYLPLEGLRVAECDDLPDDTLQTATFSDNGAYNPVTDSHSVTSVTTPVYKLDYNQLYRLHSASDAQYNAGDVGVLVPKTALTPAVGTQMAMQGAKWRVLTVQSELDCWLMHMRLG